MPEDNQFSASVRPESESGSVTVTTLPRNIVMHRVMPEELDALISGGFSMQIQMGIVGIAFGAFISILTTLLSGTLTDRAFGAYIAACLVTALFTLQGGGKIYAEWRKVRDILSRIRGQAPPTTIQPNPDALGSLPPTT